MNYKKEQNEWDQFVETEIGSAAKLISVSVSSSDCRVYKAKSNIFKIKRFTPATIRGRLNSLEDEYLILKRLQSISSTPKPVNYWRQGVWEVLEMTEIPPLHIIDPTFGQPREAFNDFCSVVKFAWSINKLGCSHGDYHFQNAGKNRLGEVSVFDFDQAIIANPVYCFLRDFFCIGAYSRATDVSLAKRAKKVQIIWPFFSFFSLLRKLVVNTIRPLQTKRGVLTSIEIPIKNRAELLNDDSLNILAEAWCIAASSNASSPGKELAYYSLDISGINYPGERPWALRWNPIKNSIVFNGKKFLELGCNMGLLSTHVKLAGASEAFGVDVDETILKAAKLSAKAFGAEVNFELLNLDDGKKWEKDLEGYDIVSALSVMHWVKDKRRLWSFLGKHNEVIYEGHETDDEARKSLNELGFTNVQAIMQSERGRNVFYASKF